MENIIRQAETSDLESIVRLANEIGASHHKHAPDIFLPPDYSGRDVELWKQVILEPSSVVFVSENEKGVNGFIAARVTEQQALSFLVQSKICRIGTIVVSDAHQGKGMGRRLMAELETWAKAAGASEVRLEVMGFNQQAKGFYEIIGYEKSSEIHAKKLA